MGRTKRQERALWTRLKPEVKAMRQEPTRAENALWERLRNRQILGFKFRRQHPIDRFIVDFCCTEAGLVIEVDGPIHDRKEEEDTERQKRLEQLNMRVIRFDNETILQSPDSVMRKIEEVLTTRG